MIRIKNYDHGTVQDNTNFVKFPAQGVIVQGTGDPTTNVTAPNNFLNDPVVCA